MIWRYFLPFLLRRNRIRNKKGCIQRFLTSLLILRAFYFYMLCTSLYFLVECVRRKNVWKSTLTIDEMLRHTTEESILFCVRNNRKKIELILKKQHYILIFCLIIKILRRIDCDYKAKKAIITTTTHHTTVSSLQTWCSLSL